jgi:hypothetical protein
MAMHLVIDDFGGLFRWRIEQRLTTGADVVAQSSTMYRDRSTCHRAVRQLAGTAIVVSQRSDGTWRWMADDEDGHPLAESAVVFPDATSCGHSLADVRRFAATLAAPRAPAAR